MSAWPSPSKSPATRPCNRRDLRDARQRLETIGAVGLAEEHAAAKLRGGEAPGRGQLVLPEDLAQRGAGVIVVPGKRFRIEGIAAPRSLRLRHG
jgi:hypothetical protein